MNYRGPFLILLRARLATPEFLPVCLLAGVFLVATGCHSSQSELHLQSGEDQLAKADYTVAQEHFSLALELDPRSAPAYLGRGKAHEGQGSLALAADDFQRALELQPKLTLARERLILVLVEMGNAHEALEVGASVAGDLTPALLLARGRARLQLEQTAVAILDFDTVLKNNPENASAHYYRGLAQAKLDKLSAAERDFTAAIALDGAHARAYWQRGLVRERQGTMDLADSDRQKAVELDPRLNFAQSQIGKNMIESLTGQGPDGARLEALANDNN